MSPAQLAYECNGERIPRERFYAIACDPARSVAVEACAGAGKTWMLVSRILRALLAGSAPHEILAITFTKKAAGEMRQRLSQWLEEFAHAGPEVLQRALTDRGVSPAQAQALQAPLKGLYAALLAHGRPVQIRTFHSWFAALLRTAPLAVLEQLGLPASYDLLEDDKEAIAGVWRRYYGAVSADPQARADFEASVATHGRFNTQKALEAALAKRVEFVLADQQGRVDGSVRPFGELFPALAGHAHPADALMTASARQRWAERARALGADTKKTPQKAAQAIVDAFLQDDAAQCLAMLRKGFFVADADRLTQHLTQIPAAQDAEPELQALCAACNQHEAWLHHQRIARLARLLLAEFASHKRERGWIDMNDVERAAMVMLSDPVLSGWVQERLDVRVRHLLIDEFQDTNPLQWQALHAWLSSYAGSGGGAGAPSVFIVGDPKQSIYRFRRAEPQVFLAAQDFVADGLDGDRLACDHTHRNAPALIEAVNAAMAQAQAAGEYEGFRPHTTESAAIGTVLALPRIERVQRAAPQDDDDAAPVWRDSLTVPRELPEEKLASLECRQAARWISAQLAAGTLPADIMVLSRRRERLSLLEDELRALHIPAQQPEKTDLCDCPEVQDIVALLDVLVSPGHDLSLARALKSPLFGVDDAALVQIALLVRQSQAQGQPRSWIELLPAVQEAAPALRGIADTLARWKKWVNQLPPHDALDAIYHEADVLARYAQASPAALRPSVLANLRALLGAALQIGGGRYATPYSLVRALRAGGVAGPSLAAPGAVRLLTVHGAKGLEAPIVLLLDTDGAPSRTETMGVIIDWPGEDEVPRRFAFLASESRPPACSADALAVEHAARRREELNALYVAMTRAGRTLVLSSVQPHVAAERSWWQRLAPFAQPIERPQGDPVAPPQQPVASIVLPVVPLPVNAAARPAEPAVAAATGNAAAALFGQAVHRLLERWTPAGAGRWPQAWLPAVAREFALPPDAMRDVEAMARRILGGEGAWAWDEAAIDWQGNEVELVHQGELLRLDRLVRRRDGQWWVLDYKSLARPQSDETLRMQLQRYRDAVSALHSGTDVRAAFLTGQGRMVTLP
jgi:ATP-dependent helicase/nuclease subunit A